MFIAPVRRGGQLLHLGVNGELPTLEVEVIILDNELGLINAVEVKRRQLGILHALKHLLTIHTRKLNKKHRKDGDNK